MKSSQDSLLPGWPERVCFFCGEAPSEADSVLRVELRHDGPADPTGAYYVTKRSVEVPRCPVCRRWHVKGLQLLALGGFIGGVMGVVACFWWLRPLDDRWADVLFGLMAGGAVGWCLAAAVRWRLRPKNIRPYFHQAKYPPIRKLLIEGWELAGEGHEPIETT